MRIYKRLTAKNVTSREGGYLLPVVIVLSLGISIAGITALRVVTDNSNTLNTGKFNEIAREAAQAGVAAATRCIEANKTDWDQGNGKPPLTPQTDCDGATVAGKPSTIVNETNVQSTYSVKGLENPYGNRTRIIVSTGTVNVKRSSGAIVKTITQTIRTFGIVNPSSKNISQISTGGNTTCAVAEGAAYCWGSNATGQLGAGAIANQSIPTAVDTTGALSGKTVTKISVGSDHTCAVASGKAYCWGNNDNGELGNRSNTSSNVPVAVDDLDTWTVSTPGYCAVWWIFGCFTWVPGTSYTYPASALYNKTIVDIKAGQDFTCALASDNTLACWGYGAYGSLGNASNADQNIPVGIYRQPTHQNYYVQSGCIWSIIIFCLFPWPPPSAAPGGWVPDSPLYNKRITGLGRPRGRTMCVTAVDPSDTTTQNAGYPYCWGQNIAPPIPNNFSQHAPCSASSSPPWPFTFGGSRSQDAGNSSEPAAMKGNIWVSSADGAMVIGDHLNALAPDGTYYYWDTGVMRTTVVSYATDYCISVILFIPWFFAGFNYDTYFGLIGEDYHAPFGSNPVAVMGGTENNLACYYVASTPYCDAHGIIPSLGQLGDGLIWSLVSSGWKTVKLNGTASLGSQLPITGMDTGSNHVCVIASQKAYCWGSNSSGQVGNNTFTNALQPAAVDAGHSTMVKATASTFDNPVSF